jgi:hypothetical protein
MVIFPCSVATRFVFMAGVIGSLKLASTLVVEFLGRSAVWGLRWS